MKLNLKFWKFHRRRISVSIHLSLRNIGFYSWGGSSSYLISRVRYLCKIWVSRVTRTFVSTLDWRIQSFNSLSIIFTHLLEHTTFRPPLKNYNYTFRRVHKQKHTEHKYLYKQPHIEIREYLFYFPIQIHGLHQLITQLDNRFVTFTYTFSAYYLLYIKCVNTYIDEFDTHTWHHYSIYATLN